MLPDKHDEAKATLRTLRARLQKPRPKLLDKRDKAANLARIDREERATCRQRSGGQCEVRGIDPVDLERPHIPAWLRVWRCARRATENHHLKSGIGRRNRGASILAAHRLDVCARCHKEITHKVLVPVDGTKAEDAATVRYERIPSARREA